MRVQVYGHYPPSPSPGSLVEHVNLKVRDALGRGIVVNPSYTVEVIDCIS